MFSRKWLILGCFAASSALAAADYAANSVDMAGSFVGVGIRSLSDSGKLSTPHMTTYGTKSSYSVLMNFDYLVESQNNFLYGVDLMLTPGTRKLSAVESQGSIVDSQLKQQYSAGANLFMGSVFGQFMPFAKMGYSKSLFRGYYDGTGQSFKVSGPMLALGSLINLDENTNVGLDYSMTRYNGKDVAFGDDTVRFKPFISSFNLSLVYHL